MDNNSIKYSFIIPVLNEERTIESTLNNLFNVINKDESVEVLLVDNGCTDNTVEKVQRFNVGIIKERKRGYGQALRTGLKKSKGEYIIIFDGDNTYDLTKLPLMLKLSIKYDLVIGNRLHYKENFRSFRTTHLIGNKLLALIVNLFFKTKIQDTQSGFRLFNKSKFLNLSNTIGMEYALDILLRALKYKYRIIEIPIRYYSRPNQSKSKLELKRDGIKIFRQFIINLIPPKHVSI
jgi:glycosyltransferase involved in cell wall biosynthesis